MSRQKAHEKATKKKFIIGVDFDGTVVEHQFPKIGTPVPGAVDWLRQLQAQGAHIILWTVRSDHPTDPSETPLTDAVEWCLKNGIHLYGVNVNPEQHTWSSSRKAYCHIYVDDLALGCPLVYPSDGRRPFVDWEIVGPMLMKAAAAQLV